MVKQLSCWQLLLLLATLSATANAESAPPQIVPLLQHDSLQLDAQTLHASSLGVMLNTKEVAFTGLYTAYRFSQPLELGFPRRYHSIEALLEVTAGDDHYIALLSSDSDQPISGGINTYKAGALWGRELIHTPTLTLLLGGGLALGNFGVKTADGDNWPLLPIPLVRAEYQTDWIHGLLEMVTSPNLSFTLAPDQPWRLQGDLRFAQLRDGRDLIFDLALHYYPASNPPGINLLLGVKNDHYGVFNLGHRDEEQTLEAQFRSLYAGIDLGVLQLKAGYAFDARLRYRDNDRQRLGDGYYLSLQALFPF